MKCEFCDSDAETMVILNTPSKKHARALNTFACISCAEKSGAYCLRHEMPHIGFTDGTTACRYCIEEEVERLGEKIANKYFCKILKTMATIELQRVIAWFEPVSKTLNEPIQKSIFRSIISYSKRYSITPDEVVAEMARTWRCLILE